MNWDSGLYDQKHAFVTRYGEDLLDLLDAAPGERVLDVGCGTGHLTAKIAATGAQVIGLDQSGEMIARARAEYPQIEFRVADAAEFILDEPVDAVFSNAALHWVERAEEAIICMSRALRPAGRFVVEFGGKGNIARIAGALERAMREVATIESSAVNYFPAIGEYASLLEKHGLRVANAALFDRLTKLEEGEAGMRNWLAMFRRSVLDRAPEPLRPQVVQRAEELLRPELFRDGLWYADYRRLRIVAFKESTRTNI